MDIAIGLFYESGGATGVSNLAESAAGNENVTISREEIVVLSSSDDEEEEEVNSNFIEMRSPPAQSLHSESDSDNSECVKLEDAIFNSKTHK